MGIEVDLDDFEVEALAQILRAEILKYSTEARLEHAAGRISIDELEWMIGHANFLQIMFDKLFPKVR